MQYIYYQRDCTTELLFSIEAGRALTQKDLETLGCLIKQPGTSYEPTLNSSLTGEVVTIGPLMNFETTYSRKAVNICKKAGMEGIKRIESFTSYVLPVGVSKEAFVKSLEDFDPMTQGVYDEPLSTFETNVLPAPVRIIALVEKGVVELETVSKELGLSFNQFKTDFLLNYFVNHEKRNPTDVELFMAGQALSEHCRHGFFGADLYIGGVLQSETLFQMLKASYEINPGNCNSAFCDNASSIRGFRVKILEPERPYTTSEFVEHQCTYHLNLTAETHNYPTSISAFPGALTGIIGMERDKMGQGKGSQGILTFGGYFVAGLQFPGYLIPGERTLKELPWAARLVTPPNILMWGSNGVVDGAKKYGQPLTGGVTRSIDLILPDGERRAYIKPILYVGGMGMVKEEHLKKDYPQSGMKLVATGGPAFRIGKGGGLRSSVLCVNEDDHKFDFDGVQRGDPEMQNGVYRVIRACVEMGKDSPIAVDDDQGAGGFGNLFLEIVKLAGGRLHIRNIQCGDKTMSVLEIVSCEYQERMGFLIYSDKIDVFLQICEREEVIAEQLGEITGDGRIFFVDDNDGTTPVNLDLQKFMAELPKEEYRLQRVDHKLVPLEIPESLTVDEAFAMVCKQLSVCSKGFLVHKGDQSVGGLVAQQQCCGPMQIPVSDVSVGAISQMDTVGGATALGESPLKMMVNSAAGTRMIVAETLANICAASISSIDDISYRANWMAAAKLPGEGPIIYDAVVSLRDLSIRYKLKQGGGKDSLTMAELIDGEFIKAPVTLILSALVTVPDIFKVATPDIKKPGESVLIFLDPSKGRGRLGGSAFAYALNGQIGNECPDIDDTDLFLNTLLVVQKLHQDNMILAYHDRIGDGGLIITLAEMAMASNCGFDVSVKFAKENGTFGRLFAEEAGMVVECDAKYANRVYDILDEFGVIYDKLGITTKEPRVSIAVDGKNVFDKSTGVIRKMWEETSYQIEKRQIPNHECANQEFALYETMNTPQCVLTFKPTLPEIYIPGSAKPRAAVLRAHGTNSDREMTNVLHLAGFITQDVIMSDFTSKRLSDLDSFHMLASCGGFVDADVFGAATGFAAPILFDERIGDIFYRFLRRPNVVSFHECNGCQLGTKIGLPFLDLPKEKQPRMIENVSRRFEHRWSMVKTLKSPAVMFEGTEGSQLVIPSAHGEGRFFFPDPAVLNYVLENDLAPVRYIDPSGTPTEQYPYNPNGSPYGIAALCSENGRHVVMMPHPTRVFLLWQCRSWMPHEWMKNLKASPWLQLFQNARKYV